MRNEKGGVVDFAIPIQKWWRKKILIYNSYLNKIKLIQNTFRKYLNKKKQMNIKNNKLKERNNYKEKK